jgi:hypothetical protein
MSIVGKMLGHCALFPLIGRGGMVELYGASFFRAPLTHRSLARIRLSLASLEFVCEM